MCTLKDGYVVEVFEGAWYAESGQTPPLLSEGDGDEEDSGVIYSSFQVTEDEAVADAREFADNLRVRGYRQLAANRRLFTRPIDTGRERKPWMDVAELRVRRVQEVDVTERFLERVAAPVSLAPEAQTPDVSGFVGGPPSVAEPDEDLVVEDDLYLEDGGRGKAQVKTRDGRIIGEQG